MMKKNPRTIRSFAVAALLLGASPIAADGPSPAKQDALAAVEAHRTELIALADQIWTFAETALQEHQSAQVLADYAESQGFRVERGVADLPTAFVASYGRGRPVIGILGEYDALPGLSQKAQPEKDPRVTGAGGHGCGHNLFGPASLGAALAVKEQIAAGRLQGTVKFFGTPAEEAVGGKLYMIRAGLFDDLDAAVAWHPDTVNGADTGGSQSMIELFVSFRGKASHAAADPWNGHSALDGLELFLHALNLHREHVRPTVRMHYTITSGGNVPNVVPEEASAWVWVRDSTHAGVDGLIHRVEEMAAGAARATATQSQVRRGTGDYEMLVNMAGSRIVQRNLELLGPVPFGDAEQDLAHQIQRSAGVPQTGLSTAIDPFVDEPGEPDGGSTDVADVSWAVPTLNLVVATAPQGVPWHAWPVVAAGGTSIGHTGMLYAARALAATMVDLFEDPSELAAVRAEFEAARAGQQVELYLPPGPPPVAGGV